MTLLLALPNVDIARRFHQVFSTTPRPPKPGRPAPDGRRAAVTCELQMSAKIDLSQAGQAQNCATSMRRSICEATGIQRIRVQVLSVKESGGSILGWAALQWSGLQKAFMPGPPDPNRPTSRCLSELTSSNSFLNVALSIFRNNSLMRATSL